MKRPYNHLWYRTNDDLNFQIGFDWKPFPKGTLVCYEHDNPNCEICPKCKNEDLCEYCWGEIKKHTESQLQKCLKKLSISHYRLKELEFTIAYLCSHNLVMKTVKVDNEMIYNRDTNHRPGDGSN